MATKGGLAAVVALLALSGAALADSGAHYYMPHSGHRPAAHAHSGGSHKAAGVHRTPLAKIHHGATQHDAQAKHKVHHQAKHHVK